MAIQLSGMELLSSVDKQAGVTFFQPKNLLLASKNGGLLKDFLLQRGLFNRNLHFNLMTSVWDKTTRQLEPASYYDLSGARISLPGMSLVRDPSPPLFVLS